MTTYAELLIDLSRRRSNGETYESIARSFASPISRAHIWKIINRGWEPTGPELRLRLGLPAVVPVVPVNGSVIPAGSLVHHADQCNCGRWFVSNHPLRRRCFVCSPYRGHR